MFKASAVKCKVITTDAVEDGGKTMPWGSGGARGNTSKEEEGSWITGAEMTTAEKEHAHRGMINF